MTRLAALLCLVTMAAAGCATDSDPMPPDATPPDASVTWKSTSCALGTNVDVSGTYDVTLHEGDRLFVQTWTSVDLDPNPQRTWDCGEWTAEPFSCTRSAGQPASTTISFIDSLASGASGAPDDLRITVDAYVMTGDNRETTPATDEHAVGCTRN